MTIAGGPIISGKPRDGIETTKMDSGSKNVEIIFLNFRTFRIFFEIFRIFLKIVTSTSFELSDINIFRIKIRISEVLYFQPTKINLFFLIFYLAEC